MTVGLKKTLCLLAFADGASYGNLKHLLPEASLAILD